MPNETLPHFVAIGASGGEGLSDIGDLLTAFPPSLAGIVMVVLHRPSDRISHLREVLGRKSKVPVRVAGESETMEAGVCYIGEPGGHLTLMDTVLAHLVPGAQHQLRNRTIDTLFKSLAQHAPDRTIAVILSGSLSDGSKGLAAIHKAGGLTMVLDPGHKPRGMQQNAIDCDGPIGFIGTSAEVAAVIVQTIGTRSS